jgi:hypothetical protein
MSMPHNTPARRPGSTATSSNAPTHHAADGPRRRITHVDLVIKTNPSNGSPGPSLVPTRETRVLSDSRVRQWGVKEQLRRRVVAIVSLGADAG